MTYVLTFALFFGHWFGFDRPARTHITPHCQNGLPECNWPTRGGGE